MCDGFSEAFMAVAAGATADAGAVAGGYTTMASVGTALGGATAAAVSPMGLAIGSAAIGGLGTVMQASAQQQSAQYQSQVAANNAKLANLQASSAIQQGQLQQEQVQLQAAQTSGAQKAALASNGLDLNSGSSVDILGTTKFLTGQDVAAISTNAARAAWGYETQSSSYTAQAGLDKLQARNSDPLAMGALSTGGTLLTSASLYRAGGSKALTLFGGGA